MKKSILFAFIYSVFVLDAGAQICPGTPGEIKWECWQGLYDDEIGDLTSVPTYPFTPDVVQTRYKIQSPSNYDNDMGARMRGFIYVPSTETVTFNLTGNHRAQFYLSTDANPDNKVLLSYTDNYTDIEEHDKYPTQTSVPVTLQTGVDYYFEVIYIEGGGYDHAVVWWKTDLVDTSQWNIVNASYIKGVDCLPDPCPSMGSACDDGDPTTFDDVEDGYCNCLGVPTSTNICIGERGLIEAYRYDSIPGGDLNDLLNNPDFPAMPDYSEVLNFFGKPRVSNVNEVGSLVQGYLSVPVTGNYKFNVTGDDQTVLFLSSDDSPVNKQAHQAFVSSWTYMTQHDKFIWQSTSNIYLEKGRFYYMEINHKEGGGSEHFSAFWQTPFTEADTWKRIPSQYMFDYDKDCELACISENTPCDDGDPFTNNDRYDANCLCVGTPCTGPDCDSPLANYIPYDKCSVTDQIDNRADNNWLSCTVSNNPNALRERSHWIQYDLQEKHVMHQSQVWNYNASGQGDKGFQNVAVDYSLDGSNWTELGSYIWTQANGDDHYTGFVGPDFAGAEARYILLTSLDDTTTCRGIGKVAFTAVFCPDMGTVCDDNDPNTLNDQYDDNCICKGTNFLENQCEEMFLMLGDTLLTTDNYSAVDFVQSISEIESNSKVSFIGGNSISLNVGFETQGSTVFVAAIDTCETTNINGDQQNNRRSFVASKKQEEAMAKLKGLQVLPKEGSDIQLIKFYIDSPGKASLKIYTKADQLIYTLAEHDFKNIGLYTKRLRTKKMESGVYSVKLQTPSSMKVEKLKVQ